MGQTPLPEDVNDAFILLNSVLGQWNSQRWLAPHLIDVFIPSQGLQSYTLGAGGDFNIGRVDRIEAAYARLNFNTNTPIDYPLQIIEAYEDYVQIPNKHLQTFPSQVFYDSGYPLGTVYFYPVPNTQFTLHLVVKQTLDQLPTLKSPLVFPPEYTEALLWNLVARLRIAYQMPPDPAVIALATGSLQIIRMSNAQIRTARMPKGLGVWTGRGSKGNTGLQGHYQAVFTFGESVLVEGVYPDTMTLPDDTVVQGGYGTTI